RMSVPSSTTEPAVGSMSRVRQRIRVDLPDPERPMTTKISPGSTSKETSRTATVHPVASRTVSRSWRSYSLPMMPSAFLPKIFHRLRTENFGSGALLSCVSFAGELMEKGSPLVAVLRTRGARRTARRCQVASAVSGHGGGGEVSALGAVGADQVRRALADGQHGDHRVGRGHGREHRGV